MTQTDREGTGFLHCLYDQLQGTDSARVHSAPAPRQGEIPVRAGLTQIRAADGRVPLHESLTTTTGPIWASWLA